MFVITGGGSGLGRALAFALAKRDHAVMIVGRNEAHLEEVSSQYSSIEYCKLDVTQAKDRARLATVLATKPLIRGLVHNAGVIDPIAEITSITEHAWRTCMATNLDAPLFLTQALLSRLTQGRVLHIGSGAAYFPVKGWAAYCVSKAAISMLTRCFQEELPSLPVASVMPGIVDTPMQAVIRGSAHMEEHKHDFFCQLKESGRLLTSETVAQFLSWLLLDVANEDYVAQEWDIYDSSHHSNWLKSPHVVPSIS